MKPWKAGNLFLSVVAVLCVPGRTPAFIDSPAEMLTLPRVVLEFRSIGIYQIERLELGRGGIQYKHVEQIQGKPPAAMLKHAVKLGESVPAELAKLKTGQRAVFFSGDGYGRGITFVAGAWYVSTYDGNTSWWPIAYTVDHYDMNCAFAGNDAELAESVRRLLKGQTLTVRCRKKSKMPETQFVRVSLSKPHEKPVVPDPGKQPPKVAVAAKPSVPTLLTQLKDKDAATRVNAAEALGRAGSDAKSAAPALIAALAEDKDPFVRRMAAVALGEIGADAKSAVPALVALVQSQYENIDGLVGSECAVALAKIDPKGAATVAVLSKSLKDADAGARMTAADKLAIIGPTVKSAAPALIEALKDKEGGVRYAVANALGSIEADAKAAVPALIPALKDVNDHVRRAAARALGNFGKEAKAAVPALTAAQKDPNEEVRQCAAEALKRIQGQ